MHVTTRVRVSKDGIYGFIKEVEITHEEREALENRDDFIKYVKEIK